MGSPLMTRGTLNVLIIPISATREAHCAHRVSARIESIRKEWFSLIAERQGPSLSSYWRSSARSTTSPAEYAAAVRYLPSRCSVTPAPVVSSSISRARLTVASSALCIVSSEKRSPVSLVKMSSTSPDTCLSAIAASKKEGRAICRTGIRSPMFVKETDACPGKTAPTKVHKRILCSAAPSDRLAVFRRAPPPLSQFELRSGWTPPEPDHELNIGPCPDLNR